MSEAAECNEGCCCMTRAWVVVWLDAPPDEPEEEGLCEVEGRDVADLLSFERVGVSELFVRVITERKAGEGTKPKERKRESKEQRAHLQKKEKGTLPPSHASKTQTTKSATQAPSTQPTQQCSSSHHPAKVKALALRTAHSTTSHKPESEPEPESREGPQTGSRSSQNPNPNSPTRSHRQNKNERAN